MANFSGADIGEDISDAGEEFPRNKSSVAAYIGDELFNAGAEFSWMKSSVGSYIVDELFLCKNSSVGAFFSVELLDTGEEEEFSCKKLSFGGGVYTGVEIFETRVELTSKRSCIGACPGEELLDTGVEFT